MSYNVSYEMTDGLLMYALNRFFLRFFGWYTVVLFLVLVFDCLAMVAFLDMAGVAKILAAFLLIGFCIIGCVYFALRSRALNAHRKSKHQTMTMSFSDDVFVVETALGRSEARWEAVSKLWRFDKTWLLFVSHSSYLVLPTCHMNDQLMEFLVAKAGEVGAKVK